MNMKKLLGLGFAAALFAGQANAGFISVVNGADMAGISVTATFTNLSTETFIWTSSTSSTSSTSTAGGVDGTDWELMVDGDTIIPNSATPLMGTWQLVNSNPELVSLFINLGTAFVFDTEYNDVSANGSGPGREFLNFFGTSTTGSFSNLMQDELYYGLTLTNISAGETLFGADTDAVPTPATLSLLGLALLGLAAGARRKKA